MPNVRYKQIINRGYLVNMLLIHKIPMDELAKMEGVPYNCLAYQVKHKLTPEEQKQIVCKRIRYSWKEKIAFLKECKATSISQVAREYGLTTGKLRAWKKQYREMVEKRRAEAEQSGKKSLRKSKSN